MFLTVFMRFTHKAVWFWVQTEEGWCNDLLFSFSYSLCLVWRLLESLLSTGKPQNSLKVPHRGEALCMWAWGLQQGVFQCFRPSQAPEPHTLKWGSSIQHLFHYVHLVSHLIETKRFDLSQIWLHSESYLSLLCRNHMCVRSQVAQNVIQTPVLSGNMWRPFMVQKHMSLRSSVVMCHLNLIPLKGMEKMRPTQSMQGEEQTG